MDWIDIASIVFVCVTANHLGLISKIEDITRKKFPVINCTKCSTFWVTLIFFLWKSEEIMGEFPLILAISFLASYSAIWLELFEGFIDTLYLKLYGKITSADSNNEATTSADDGNTASTMPKL